MIARGWKVTGRVQGVGFRWWTREMATELGLSGTVRNCSDGSVEVIASGSAEALDRLEALLGDGPRYASVGSVTRMKPGHEISAGGFNIVR